MGLLVKYSTTIHSALVFVGNHLIMGLRLFLNTNVTQTDFELVILPPQPCSTWIAGMYHNTDSTL